MTVAVVEAISSFEGRPPDTLPPLHDAVRNDLGEIFDFVDDGTASGRNVRLTFEYMDYYVTVENGGTISVERKPENPFAI